MRKTFLGCTALLTAVSIYALAPSSGALAASQETYRQLNLFGEVFEKIRSDYVEEINDGEAIEAAINGMLASLDPHSSYMNAKSFRDMQVQTRGEFGGLGIEVTMEQGLVKVVSPIDDTPAAKAGIKANDLIVALNGEQVLGLTLQEAVERMRGPANSELTLTIQRAGVQKPFDVTLTRAIIKVQSVRSRTEGDIGYVRITSFTEQTEGGLTKAIQKLKEDIGAEKIKGYILDLRNNPGGLLDQAVAVSDAFLDKGEIVSTRGRRSEEGQRYNARRGDLADAKPMIVLINGGSASASEIVAGALQDHRRAVVLGTKSFGKGSVQTIIPIQGHGALRLTTARYYTPSGRSIQAKGIEPDIEVEQAKVETAEGTTSTPRTRSEADLRRHLRGPDEQPGAPAPKASPKAAPKAPETSQVTPPAGEAKDNDGKEQADAKEPSKNEDHQLTYALNLLRGATLFAPKASN
jgi:carboxyl-terminal processing protease